MLRQMPADAETIASIWRSIAVGICRTD